MTGKTCLKCWLYFMPGTCPAPSSSEKHFTRTLFGWGVSNIFSCWISNMIFRAASVLDACMTHWIWEGVLQACWLQRYPKELWYKLATQFFNTLNLTFSLGPLFCTNLLTCNFFYWPRSCYLWKSCSWLHTYMIRVSEVPIWLEIETEIQPENSLRKRSILCLSFKIASFVNDAKQFH